MTYCTTDVFGRPVWIHGAAAFPAGPHAPFIGSFFPQVPQALNHPAASFAPGAPAAIPPHPALAASMAPAYGAPGAGFPPAAYAADPSSAAYFRAAFPPPAPSPWFFGAAHPGYFGTGEWR